MSVYNNKKDFNSQAVVAHDFNLSTRESEAGGLLCVQSKL